MSKMNPVYFVKNENTQNWLQQNMMSNSNEMGIKTLSTNPLLVFERKNWRLSKQTIHFKSNCCLTMFNFTFTEAYVIICYAGINSDQFCFMI